MTKLGHAALYPPTMNRASALGVFICTIFFPGITQIFVGIFNGCDLMYMLVGLVQLLAAPILLGFIWSIVWGWNGVTGSSSEPAPNA